MNKRAKLYFLIGVITILEIVLVIQTGYMVQGNAPSYLVRNSILFGFALFLPFGVAIWEIAKKQPEKRKRDDLSD